MVTEIEMKSWNYGKAWDYFIGGERLNNPEAMQYLSRVAKFGRIFDIRDSSMDMNFIKFIEEAAKIGTLFFVDGCSCTGKSTFANKMAEKYNANVVDVDLECMKYITSELGSIKDEFAWYMLLMNYQKITDDFIHNNLEKIVEKASEGGTKSVFLVGMYLEFIHRAMVGTIFGKYFKMVIGFVTYEKPEVIAEWKRNRDKEFGNDDSEFVLPGEDKMVLEEKEMYEFLKKVMTNPKNKAFLGIGTDCTFIINSNTNIWLNQ